MPFPILLLLIFLLAVLFAFIGRSLYILMTLMTFFITHATFPDQTRANNLNQLSKFKVDPEAFEATYLKESFVLFVHDHEFVVDRLAKEPNPKGTFIMVHGFTNGRKSLYKEAEMLLDLGYDVYLYDQRYADSNTANYLTFGVLEAHDLWAVIDRVESRSNLPLYVWAVSYGSATALIALGQNAKSVQALIVDSPLSSFPDLFKEYFKAYSGLPQWLFAPFYQILRWWIKRHYRFDFDAAAPIDYIGQLTIPLLIFSQAKDKVTPEWMAKDLEQAKTKGFVYRSSVDDAAHTGYFVKHYQKYKALVEKFLQKQA